MPTPPAAHFDCDPIRRRLLGAGVLLAAAGWSGLSPSAAHALAVEAWPESAFRARDVVTALNELGANTVADSNELILKTPDVAENGGAVAIEIASRLREPHSIAVLVDRNPVPMVLQTHFPPGVEHFLAIRIKMAESSKVRLLAFSGGRVLQVQREVRVTLGGCG